MDDGSGLNAGDGMVVVAVSVVVGVPFLSVFFGRVFNLGLFLLKSQCGLLRLSTAARARSPAGNPPFFGVCSGEGGLAKALSTMLNSRGIKMHVSIVVLVQC